MSPQQPNPTQDSSNIVQEKSMQTIEKGKSIAIDASSSDIIAANGNNKISNDNGKAVMVIASNKKKAQDKVFICQYCDKEFGCQQAMAGHSNIHRNKWTLSPKRKRRNRKIQIGHKHLNHPKPSPHHNSIIARLLKSFASTSSTPVRDGASTSCHKPILRAPEYPLAKPLKIIEGPSVRVPVGPPPRHSYAKHLNIIEGPSARATLGPPPTHSLANPLNILEGPSARAPLRPPQYSSANSKNTLNSQSLAHSLASLLNTFNEPSPNYHLAQLINTFNGASRPARAKLSPYPTNTTIWPSLGAPQRTFIGPENIPHVSSILDLNQPSDNRGKPHGKSSLGVRYECSMIKKPSHRGHLGQADKLVKIGPEALMRKQIEVPGTDSCSRCVCGGNIEAREFAFFPLTSSKKRHNHGVDHSSQNSEVQSGNNGEDVDDVDLKL